MNGDSVTPQSPWNSLSQANSYEFRAGDALLLKRGSSCQGMLAPKGSGDPDRPITIGAYGTGALPIVIGTGNAAALKLENQQYWNAQDLELVGGSPYGVFITGSLPSLSHFHLSNLVVHGVTGVPKTKDTGLVVVAPESKSGALFHDIVIDGITAFDTTEWAGIVVSAGSFDKGRPHRGTDVIIRNSVVHNIAGDGILLMVAHNGRLERNVAWDVGMEYSYSIGTPDGIWEWMCEDCLVQYNEGFFTDSPGVDGGVFDIDFGNINNTVQYNFGHDSQGYCVSVFGAEGAAGFSRNSIVRGNLCLENGRSPREAQRQGAIYLSTWDGGKLSNVEVYGNTVLWDPPVDTAAIVSDAEVDPAATRLVHHNLIISRTGPLVRSAGGLQFSDNQYWISTASSPSWQMDGVERGGLQQTQSAGYETRSAVADPHLNAVFQPSAALESCQPLSSVNHDIYGTPMTACAGAVALANSAHREAKPKLGAPSLRLQGKPFLPHGWILVAQLVPEGQAHSDESRSQMVVLQSMQKQFGALGLQTAVLPARPLSAEAASNWNADWDFGTIKLLDSAGSTSAKQSNGAVSLLLISPGGQVVESWNGLTAAPAVELTLRSLLGTPVGMQTLPAQPPSRERRRKP